MKAGPVSTLQCGFELTQLKLDALKGRVVPIAQLPQHIAKEHGMLGVAFKQRWQHPLKGGENPDSLLLLWQCCRVALIEKSLGQGVGIDQDQAVEVLQKAVIGQAPSGGGPADEQAGQGGGVLSAIWLISAG